MRKIHFDEETVSEIKNYVESGHTIQQTCNRFTLKYDTLKRVMREHSIEPYVGNNSQYKFKAGDEVVNEVKALFLATNTRLADICKQCKLEYWQLQQILNDNFSKAEQDVRKAKLYRASKVGDKNPMKSCKGTSHLNYKGIISDGNGYCQQLKPEWYTGRKNSKYVFTHHVSMCESLGITEIPKGFCVHHINGDKQDNDPSNLALMSISAHSKLHRIQRNLCKVQRLSVME